MKLRLTILLLLVSVLALPSAMIIRKVAEAGGCTTPTTGDEMNEGFLGSGFENSGSWGAWSDYEGTPNEDFTLSGTPPTGSCTEGMNVNVSAANAIAQRDRGSAIDQTAVSTQYYFSIYVDSITIDAFTGAGLISWGASTTPATSVLAGTYISYQGGPIRLQSYGATHSDPVEISPDTWYEVIVTTDTAGGATGSTMEVVGVSTVTFQRGSNNGRYFFAGINNIEAGESADIEFGYIYVNTP